MFITLTAANCGNKNLKCSEDSNFRIQKRAYCDGAPVLINSNDEFCLVSTKLLKSSKETEIIDCNKCSNITDFCEYIIPALPN